MKFNSRQTKYGSYALVYTLIIVGVLGAANWLAQEHNKSFDTTSAKKFTLSEQTEKLVKNLKQDVSVTYFDDQKAFNNARDLLDRYRNLSSKLKIEYVDPNRKPTVAKAAGIRSLGTIILTNGAKREEAKSMTEEEITGALVRLIKEGSSTICVVSGSGERAIEDSGRSGFSGAKEALEKSNYKVQAISLVEAKAEVPAECTAVIVAGPRREYFDVAVDGIKRYVEGGGRALFLIDPPLQFGKENIARNEKLVAAISGWGIEIHSDLALDTSPVGQLFGFNELVPVVTRFENHLIVRDLGNVMAALPITSTIAPKAGVAETLFSTSQNSYSTTNLSSPEIRIDPKKDKQGPFPLAAAATVKSGEKEGRIVVVGSSDWATNSLIGARQIANRDVFLNMTNWLTSDEDLISIRPKDPEDRRLAMTGRSMRALFFSNVIGIPLAIILSGVVMWWKRR